jgi:GMP synthase-like glutamine amidotransferase
MRAHYLQHVSFETLGSIEIWLKNNGFEISKNLLPKDLIFPEIENIDFLIVMGGPMSVNDENQYGWLIEEKRYIKNFIGTGKPTLGVCLGAQLIANVLGAKVYPNLEKEIGWFPIHVSNKINNSALDFIENKMVFHWHGETFDLPIGAIHLAESMACKNQAFQYGNSVIGLQFHLEVTPETVNQLINGCRNELLAITKYVQTEKQIEELTQKYHNSANILMEKILTYITKKNNG